MKYNFGFLLIIITLHANGQVDKDNSYVTRKDLIGVWQRDSRQAGNGLEQNFRFFNDSTFEVYFSNSGEDARDIYGLKGTYRLVKGKLYLTIKSRIVTEGGRVTINESTESSYLFEVTGGTKREIPEPEPKESAVPITVVDALKGKIMLDNEAYYKLTKADLTKEGINTKF